MPSTPGHRGTVSPRVAVPFKTAAVVQADKSAHQPLYLLDGQQRLTSLAWVHRPESRADGRLVDVGILPEAHEAG
ncbi:DUF262 domain-containing protein [Streptomyces sp. AC627_RSS907]|uniref:DUF262 domain-containing protein n=1 Tax=Streptomyces sp. AC627_RSS907 TaxID=2823684 RepID=UPI0020B7A843|nr:DUF262 domain-containing protein [Streptomyces sp. AC627_RSS907]